MTNKEAIALLESGSKMPDTKHTSEMLDEACRLACRALRKEPHICTTLGVWPGQVFFWRGYTLKVDEDGTVCKSMKGDLWLGLEGSAVCDLINNAEEIMRTVAKETSANPPLTLSELNELDGEPVWVTSGCGEHPMWYIVDVEDNELKNPWDRITLENWDEGWPYKAYRFKLKEGTR